MYYIKKATVQDVTRTFVLNRKAIDHFFCLNLLDRDDEAFVAIRYRTDGELQQVRIVLKQDPRIFFDRFRLEPRDIVLFHKEEYSQYKVTFIKNNDSRFGQLSSILNRYNYAILDSII
jgi:hypothetical protein